MRRRRRLRFSPFAITKDSRRSRPQALPLAATFAKLSALSAFKRRSIRGYLLYAAGEGWVWYLPLSRRFASARAQRGRQAVPLQVGPSFTVQVGPSFSSGMSTIAARARSFGHLAYSRCSGLDAVGPYFSGSLGTNLRLTPQDSLTTSAPCSRMSRGGRSGRATRSRIAATAAAPISRHG